MTGPRRSFRTLRPCRKRDRCQQSDDRDGYTHGTPLVFSRIQTFYPRHRSVNSQYLARGSTGRRGSSSLRSRLAEPALHFPIRRSEPQPNIPDLCGEKEKFEALVRGLVNTRGQNGAAARACPSSRNLGQSHSAARFRSDRRSLGRRYFGAKDLRGTAEPARTWASCGPVQWQAILGILRSSTELL